MSSDRTPPELLPSSWAEAWREPGFRRRLLATPVALAVVLRVYSSVLSWVQRRPGAAMPDPILALLPPRNLTWLIFALIYVGLLVGLARLASRPHALVVGVQAYTLMIVLRMVALYLTPLDAPTGLILLRDPFAEHIAVGEELTRDLFFSGHTSTMFLLYLAVPGRRVRWLFLFCTAAVGVALLWQHVHYTVDVAAAPLFAWASYRVAARLQGARADVTRPA